MTKANNSITNIDRVTVLVFCTLSDNTLYFMKFNENTLYGLKVTEKTQFSKRKLQRGILP